MLQRYPNVTEEETNFISRCWMISLIIKFGYELKAKIIKLQFKMKVAEDW
jgi:hypothetical protein